jgi:uncharacterized protein
VAEPVQASSLAGLGIRDVRIKTPDGETLDAWFAPPAPGKPVILYLHGNGGRLSDARWRYIRMHAQGAGYLALSYRGYGNSTGRPTEEGLEMYWFIPVSWLMSDHYASRSRIKDVHVPILIAHGENDSVVPFTQGVALYGLANAPKTFVRMRGSDHSTLTRDGVYHCYWKFLGLPYDADDAARICAPL